MLRPRCPLRIPRARIRTDAYNQRRTQSNSASTKSLYIDTLPPSAEQASAASHFFQTHRPHISWVANEWRKQAHSQADGTSALLTPEIAFLGRSNTGKSSLLNALLHSPQLCRVGSKPGKTTTMHAWTLSSQTPHNNNGQKDNGDRFTVLDMPGYGHGSRDEWGTDIVRYLCKRRQLRRAMVLLNPKHGIKQGDMQILELLAMNGIPHQIIACKSDMLPSSELLDRLMNLREDLGRNEAQGSNKSIRLNDILTVGKLGDGKMNKTHSLKAAFGLDEVRWAILQAVGLDEFALQQDLPRQRSKVTLEYASVGDAEDISLRV